MEPENRNELVKERILNEAEALFAQRGYRGVTVREIIKAAECNLSAVNYYFGNKKKLYFEVFRSRWVPRANRLHECFQNFLATQGSASPSSVVEALARTFLEGPLSDEERERHYQLMTRELAQPGEAFDLVVEEIMRRHHGEVGNLLRSTAPEGVDKESLTLKIMSINAMVHYFNFARLAITRLTGREYDASFKARLVEHITEFSLQGLGVTKTEKPQ